MNSEIFDQLSERFLSDEDENISSLKIQMLKSKSNYDAILAIYKGSASKSSDMAFVEYIALIKNQKDTLKEYYDVDPYFVIHAVRLFNSEIIELIRYFKCVPDSMKKLVAVCVSFTVLNAIPNFHLKESFVTDYEPLLDSYLNPKILALNPNVADDIISKVITIPSAKIEISTLEKLYLALNVCINHDAEERFHIAVILSLFWRIFDDKIFLKTFNTVVEFYESNQLEISSVVLSLLMKLLCSSEHYLASNVLKLCREKKLLPKTFAVIVDRCLEDFRQIGNLQKLMIKNSK